MSAILETNIYSPSISKIDPNNDIPNQQLANRTLYLKTTLESLQQFLNTYKIEHNKDYTDLLSQVKELSNSLKELQNTSKNIDEKSILENLVSINKTIKDLQETFKNHTHLYASSKRPGGDANSVDVIEDNVSEFNIVGSTELLPTKLRKSTKVTIENDTVKANLFKGNLKGNSDSSTSLQNSPRITLSGDIIGTTIFKGDEDVVIKTNLKDQNVSAGEYGTVGNYTLGSNGSFTVPSITVNSLGLITKIQNRTITLPKNLGINGITSSLPTQKKIYIIGTSEQSEKSATYSQNNVYINNGAIYSNDKEVINDGDFQALKNKTYEGYELSDACARGVDETIGGSPNDSRLVTSNALYRHKHKYALSDTLDGKALYSKIEDSTEKSFLVTNHNLNGSLSRNTNVYTYGNGLFGKDLTAIENMYIPGGKIWIDSVSVPIEDDSWHGGAELKEDTSNIQKKTREVKLNSDLDGSSGNIKVFAGNLLAYKQNGYILADNKDIVSCDNVVMATIDGISSTILVMDYGKFDIETTAYDGKNCYVGENGRIVYEPIKKRGLISKKIGYVEGNFIIFNPNPYALLIK